MIKREKYLKKIRPFINKPVIKVITGIRRCGKSTFLKMLMEELMDQGTNRKNILYINNDSLEFDNIIDYRSLNDLILKKFKGVRSKKYCSSMKCRK